MIVLHTNFFYFFILNKKLILLSNVIMLDIIITDIWYIILNELTQFDLYRLLLVCKTLYNNTILRKELDELRKWCAERIKFIAVNKKMQYFKINNYDITSDIVEKIPAEFQINIADKLYCVNLQTGEIIADCYDDDEYYETFSSPIYMFNAANGKYYMSINHSATIGPNLYYYPNPRYLIQLVDLDSYVYTVKKLRIKIHIKLYIRNKAGVYFSIKDNIYYRLYPRGGYCFALYDTY